MILNNMLRVSNGAFNYARQLVINHGFRAKQLDLQGIVCKKERVIDAPSFTDKDSVANPDWYFTKGTTSIKVTSIRTFQGNVQSTRTNLAKRKKDPIYYPKTTQRIVINAKNM